MPVKFVRPCKLGTLYNKGEIAGFDEATEKRLVEQKYAEPYKAGAKANDPK